jgi:hypothetical protein
LFLEVEKGWHYRLKVFPIGRIIGLKHQKSFRNQAPIDQSKKLRGEQSPVPFSRVMKGLWMVNVNFRNAIRRDIFLEEFVSPAYRKTNVFEPSLVGSPGGITDHNRENIDTEVVKFGAADGTCEEKSAIATPDI